MSQPSSTSTSALAAEAEPRPRPARQRGLRVAAVLMSVAVVPLMGLAVMTWQSVDQARTAADQARQTEATATQAIRLAELNSALFDEMVWRIVLSGSAELGASPEMWSQFLDVDPIQRVEETSAAVNDLITPESQRANQLALARQSGLAMTTVLTRFDNVLTANEADLYGLLDKLAGANLTAPDGQPLSTKVEALGYAINLRTTLAEQFYAYFASLISVRGSAAEEIENLIVLKSHKTFNISALLDGASTNSTIPDTIAALQADESIIQFERDVEEIIANAFATEVPKTRPDFRLETLLTNVDMFTNSLRAMTTSAGPSSAVLRQVGQELVVAAQDVRTDADAQLRTSMTLAIALTLASITAAAVATRFIVRPLRELRQVAEHLESNTDVLDPTTVAGPTEVKAASRALHDAATNLNLVTRQARALSTGELDAEVLDEVAPGGLGSALQEAVGRLRAALTAQDEAQQRLAHEATHDAMTTLANRNASLDYLKAAMARSQRTNTEIAVLFIDLDRFKAVNDEHGHHAGDIVLTKAAQRILDAVRTGDHVGRLGGDEFVVIADPVGDIQDAITLGKRIIQSIEQPINTEYGQLRVGASIGVATTETENLTADELLRDADLAVYRAKAAGTGRVEVCNEDLRNEIAATATKTSAIESAIANDELVMHYQPIVAGPDGKLHALEALVRWNKPGEASLVPPSEFIDFAEDSSLIVLLDRWVVDAVAAQLAQWSDHPTLHVPVAINISGRHLASDQFLDDVLGPLDAHGVDPKRVIVEVTESTLLNDMDGAAVKLQQLRSAGVTVAIDDFGTGYTSLAHLRSLPFDILKIDRSYVAEAMTNLQEASMVKLIIDTGHLLDAQVTAEGIECTEEATLMAALGADYLQGFYFGQPEPPQLCATADFTPAPF